MAEKQYKWDRKGIRALRSYLDMTPVELADEMGIRQQTVSEWEIGLYKPRGASSTLLSITAERAEFEYQAISAKEQQKPRHHPQKRVK